MPFNTNGINILDPRVGVLLSLPFVIWISLLALHCSQEALRNQRIANQATRKRKRKGVSCGCNTKQVLQEGTPAQERTAIGVHDLSPLAVSPRKEGIQ